MNSLPPPLPVSLRNGSGNENIKQIIRNCSSYLKTYMPEKNDHLTAHLFHLSRCTGISEKTIRTYLDDPENHEEDNVFSLSPETTSKFKKKHSKQKFIKVDDFLRDLIRQKIYLHHKNNTVISLNTLLT